MGGAEETAPYRTSRLGCSRQRCTSRNWLFATVSTGVSNVKMQSRSLNNRLTRHQQLQPLCLYRKGRSHCQLLLSPIETRIVARRMSTGRGGSCAETQDCPVALGCGLHCPTTTQGSEGSHERQLSNRATPSGPQSQ
jgi:hypothetical protein